MVETLRAVVQGWTLLSQPVGGDHEVCFWGLGIRYAYNVHPQFSYQEVNALLSPRRNIVLGRKPTSLLHDASSKGPTKPALTETHAASSSSSTTNRTKRVLPTEEDTSVLSSKKLRLDSQEPWYQHPDLLEDETDLHQYMIYNTSVTSPVIPIQHRTIRITPSAAGKDKDREKAKSQTLVFLLGDLKRSFILPTHGKPKPHYTMIMLSSDVTNLPKGSTTDSGEAHWQICIGSELSLPNLVSRSRDSPEHRHPKESSIRAAFDAF